jgi:ElaB/YqjD/DUF883 family membrane-anchored ribosome-binding protein
MPTEEMEKQGTVDEVLAEVSKIKAMLAEALDDSVRSALRAVKQGRYAAETALDDAKHVVRKNPAETVGIVFAAGLLAGGLLGWLVPRGRRATEKV